jgi:S1-C subfamily serine protease
MTLQDSYKRVKRSIVAFCAKYTPATGSAPPLFPTIIGTGFVVHPDGVIATNDHVVRAFKKVRPEGLPEDDWGVYALMLHMAPQGLLEIPLEVLGVGVIGRIEHGPAYYGPPKPDVAFVHVRAKGLDALEIGHDSIIVEGTELATAGFPMGTDALMAPGYVHQVTPTLQRGIISAVLPFACEAPHAFTLNVMTQGGASGSPVFDPSSSRVAGVLFAGLNDTGVTKVQDIYHVPTNISYVVPSHVLRGSLAAFMSNSEIGPAPGAQTIEEMIAGAVLSNILEKGRQWQVRELKPNRPPTAGKMRQLSRIEN